MGYYGASSSINAVWVIVGVFVLLLDIVVSTIADTIATEKGHKGITFGIICFLTGPIGCILVAALPDKPRIAREQKIADTLAALLSIMNNQPQSDYCIPATPANDAYQDDSAVATNAPTNAPQSSRAFVPVKEKTWVCPNCNTTNHDDAMFCVNCGEMDSRIETWTCTQCGEKNPCTISFCTNCGTAKDQ